MLWRRLRIALALIGRLAELKERLAHHPDTTADDPALIWAAVAVLSRPTPTPSSLIRRADRQGDPCLLPARPSLVLNPEVAATQWFTLDTLLQPGGHHRATLEIAGQMRDVQAYRIAEAVVWGMTERILTAFCAR